MDAGIVVVGGGVERPLFEGDPPRTQVVHLGRLLDVPEGLWVTVRAGADDYVASIPSDAFTPGAELTVSSRRLVVRDGSTLCWNVKDVRRIEIGEVRQPDSVPENPPH